jgi:hypothetical protein
MDIQTWVKLNVGCTLSLTHVCISIGLSPVCSVCPTLSLTHVCISIGLSPVCSVCPGCTEHTGDRPMDIQT